MAIIKCPECGKEISDKSKVCIHCGYPIQQNNICSVNGKEYDLTFLLDESYSILFKVRDLIQISNSDIDHVKPEVEKIVQSKQVPDFLNFPTVQNKREEQSKVHCPYCNSIDTKKITATSKAVHTAIFGIFSMGRNAKNFHCNNCNSDF